MLTVSEVVCVLQNGKGEKKGIVIFKENSKSMTIRVVIEGLTEGKHGFHIHKSGDLRYGCDSLCDHFNPMNQSHGSRTSSVRHMGDLGNVIADGDGNVDETFRDSKLRIHGTYGILGRSVVVHTNEDDLGRGGNDESLKTGNAGKRVLCGVIGISKSMCSVKIN